MTSLYLDLETFSPVPITHGVSAYSEQSEILLFAYAVDDGPVRVWDCTESASLPAEIYQAFRDNETLLIAHNSFFDRTILQHHFATFFALDNSRWRDTMVQATAHSLPGGLAALSDVLKMPIDKAKDKEGRQYIQLFCKPQPAGRKILRATRQTHPAEWAKFVEYAALDVEAMRAIQAKLPTWNYKGTELALWQLDQTINDRGVAVDVELAQAALDAVGDAQTALAAEVSDRTNSEVASATQRDALLKYILSAYDVSLPDMQAATLERRIADPALPRELRELLALRLQASSTSTGKYKTLLNAVSKDGRLRGSLQFNGASRTGRWSGRLFQPQNMPRPTLPQVTIDRGIEALKAGCADLVTANVMQLTSNVIRGCLVAPPGKKLVIADLSNIEGRVLAWLAGEEWKLDAFRAFDAGKGTDLYILAYAKSFGVTPESVTKDQRQIGKTQELALGYQGGVGAFMTFAAAYSIDMEEVAERAVSTIAPEIMAEAIGMLEWAKTKNLNRFGLSDRAWLVCESFKRSWRAAHPATTLFWKRLEEAARAAISQPGRTCRVMGLKLQRDGAWLRIQLPSDRCLCYPGAALDPSGKLTYAGADTYTRKWGKVSTYGGKLAENVTQAVARDILVSAMPAAEAAGYEIVLSVHDELICETPDSDDFSTEQLVAIMSTNPPWATGLPLAAAGFETYRYRKG